MQGSSKPSASPITLARRPPPRSESNLLPFVASNSWQCFHHLVVCKRELERSPINAVHWSLVPKSRITFPQGAESQRLQTTLT